MGLFSALFSGMTKAVVEVLASALPGLGNLLTALLPAPTPGRVARLPRVIIVGEGGAGKSTILKQMLAFAARKGDVPVWVSLALLPVNQPLTPASLIDYLVEQARRHLGMDDIQPAFFHALIEDGQLAIGFDGLDEIGSLSRQQMVRGMIMEIAREWKRCRIFVTSRPEALAATPFPMPKVPADPDVDQSAEVFVTFRPQPLDARDIRAFLQASLDDHDGKLADSILKLEGIDGLIAEPLPLTLFALMASKLEGESLNRTSLFERCIATLSESWDDAKNPGLVTDGLTVDERIAALRRIAWVLQRTQEPTIGVDAAAAALAKPDPLVNRSRAVAVVGALAQRNVLLSATRDETSGRRLRAIAFAHSQFREYLAGAHLAELFVLDPELVPGQMGDHWFDTRWLETIRFCAATLEDRSNGYSNDFFRLALAAPDPYVDLLRRPTLLAALLLASAAHADRQLVAGIVAELESIASAEPALRETAAELLVGLARHGAGQDGLVRCVRGVGIALAFPEESRLEMRLRALEALVAAAAPRDVLPLLSTMNDEQTSLRIAELRVRLGDRTGALTAWRASLTKLSDRSWDDIADSMDRAGEGATFNTWLLAAIEETPVQAHLTLGFARRLVDGEASGWAAQFRSAAAVLARLPLDEDFAPEEVSQIVYAALESSAGALSPDGRALLEQALHHPSLTWFVAPRVGALVPALAGAAIEALLYMVERIETSCERPDWSRLNIAYKAICEKTDDNTALPALSRLLAPDWHLATSHRGHVQRRSLVAETLKNRGYVAEGLEAIAPRLESPVIGGVPSIEARANWRVAYILAPSSTLDRVERWLSAPLEDAAEWLATSGAVELVAELFERLLQGAGGNALVESFAAHERQPDIAGAARSALAERRARDDTSLNPWTVEKLEAALREAIEYGRYIDQQGALLTADANRIGELIHAAVSCGSEAMAMLAADRWIAQLYRAALTGDVDGLAEALAILSQQGLANQAWNDTAAAAARTVQPAKRQELIAWLRGTLSRMETPSVTLEHLVTSAIR